MNDKWIKPWIECQIGYFITYKKYKFFTQENIFNLPVVDVFTWGAVRHHKSFNGWRYVISRESDIRYDINFPMFPTAELAMAEADKKLIENGYTLLTRDQVEKLKILI